MKHSVIQLFNYSIIQLFIILNCISCVTEYIPPDIEEITDILVVEGIISDDESVITLSRSVNLMKEGYWDPIYIDHANVYVECDDGTLFYADNPLALWGRNGRYTIKTGKLDLERKYRLKIEIEEIDNSKNCTVDPWSGGMNCPTRIYEYRSDFSYPIKTPEIDSVFGMKTGKGRPVMIHVATHSPDNQAMYYRWSYKEDWEINPEYPAPGYPSKCWSSANSMGILLGSAERTVFGQLTDKIFEFPPSNKRWSVLYRITVKQNAISKRAHDYFANIKKNAENIGSIFAPTPSELRGNIVCFTDPSRPVIGYIDISSTTQKTKYISRSDNLYERAYMDCKVYSFEELIELFGGIPGSFIRLSQDEYIQRVCVLCEGTAIKPDNWPNNY